MPIDHDAPEREELNLMESLTIVRMHYRLFCRAERKRDIACLKAAEAMRSFGKAMRDALPMDDWDDDEIAAIVRG